MTRCTLVLSEFLALASFSVLNLNVPALAQIIPDATLGNENSTVTPGATVRGGEADLIDGGAIRGSNLFHSFQEFNVGEGQRVYFANPDGIDSILSRITGGNPSNIFGTLGVDGTADLFFLNPNGILFGPGSALDIQGSLTLSTADAIQLGDDGWFSAVDPNSDDLLEVNPSVFWFDELTQPGDITVFGTNLKIPNNQSISLIAGNVLIDTGRINALGGQINISGVASSGSIRLDPEDNSFTINTTERADVFIVNGLSIQNEAGLFVNSENGGGITIFARDVLVSNFGTIRASIPAGLGTEDTVAADIQIDASRNVLVTNDSVIGNGVLGTGNGGDVTVFAENINIANGSQISTVGIAQGNVGDVNLFADNAITFSGFSSRTGVTSGILSSLAFSGSIPGVGEFPVGGESGNIQLTAPEITLSDAAIIASSSQFATANAGNITFITDKLNVLGGSRITSSTSTATGDAGVITLNVRELAIFDGVDSAGQLRSGVSSDVGQGSLGNGGDITITTDVLEVTNGALISASTLGEGTAGTLRVFVEDQVNIDGTSPDGQFRSGIASEVGLGAVGSGGNVEVSTSSLEVTNGALLTSSTFGEGNAGDVVINATGRVVFDGTSEDGQLRSAASSEIANGARGNGGRVEISTNSLEVTGGAILSASTYGEGAAGNVVINAQGDVVFDGTSEDGQFRSGANSEICCSAIGRGGSVRITARSLKVTNGATLTASTSGNGDAGDVVITAEDRIVFDGTSEDGRFRSAAGSEVSDTATGNGGNLEVSTNSLEVFNGAILTASTFGNGDAGNVVIVAEDRIILDGTTEDGEFASTVASEVGPEAIGTGGNVEIITNSLEVANGASVSVKTFGVGDAGDVVIRATGPVVFDGTTPNGESSIATSKVELGAEGNGGNVEISANSLEIINGAVLSASTQGDGNAGDVIVNITDFVNIEGFVLQGEFEGSPSGIFTRNININEIGTGAGGDVRVTTSRLSLSDGAVIDSRTANDQSGGNVDIEVGSLELLQGGQIVATSDSSGSAGSISINAIDRVQINGVDPNFAERFESFSRFGDSYEPQSNISVRSLATGRTGNILVNAPVLELEDQGQIIAESAAVDGGNIVLNLGDLLLLRNGSLISTTAGTEQSGGNGGNITISVPFIVAIPEENSDIAADAFEGSGGNVNITARGVFGIEPRPERTPLSDITASSELGVSGIINLNVLDTGFIENNLSSFEDTIIDTSTLTAGSCIARTEEDQGSFVVTGRDGLPQRPGDTGIAAYPTGTVRMVAESTANQPIQEPDGVYQLPDGRLVLSRECGDF
jgi:filamentous hemagglutinin family protein